MRTHVQTAQVTEKHGMSGWDVLMECLWQLHPAVQFDRGCGFFLTPSRARRPEWQGAQAGGKGRAEDRQMLQEARDHDD